MTTKIKTVVLTPDNWTCPYCGVGPHYEVDYGPPPPDADDWWGKVQTVGLQGEGHDDFRDLTYYFGPASSGYTVVPAHTHMICHRCRWEGTAQHVVDRHVTRRSAYGWDSTLRKPT